MTSEKHLCTLSPESHHSIENFVGPHMTLAPKGSNTPWGGVMVYVHSPAQYSSAFTISTACCLVKQQNAFGAFKKPNLWSFAILLHTLANCTRLAGFHHQRYLGRQRCTTIQYHFWRVYPVSNVEPFRGSKSTILANFMHFSTTLNPGMVLR